MKISKRMTSDKPNKDSKPIVCFYDTSCKKMHKNPEPCVYVL